MVDTYVLTGTAGLTAVVCFIRTRWAPLTPAVTGAFCLFYSGYQHFSKMEWNMGQDFDTGGPTEAENW